MAKNIPFNIFLLSPNIKRIANVLPVQSMDIFTQSGAFHPQGLYSTELFGEIGSKARNVKFSYIDLKTEIMHPKLFLELSRLKNLYAGILSGKVYATWDTQLSDFVKSDIVDGKTGYSFFMSKFNDIMFSNNESSIRDLRIKFLYKYNRNCMYRFLLVMPAGLRDIQINENKRPEEDEINLYYRKVLRAVNTINEQIGFRNDPVLDTVRWNIQSTFNDIYQYIESILEGKKGFILGKFASRKVHGSTRNVLTAYDPAAKELNSQEAVTINDTVCGLHQYLKGTVELSIYNIRTGPMERVIFNLPSSIYLIDPKTLKQVQVSPSKKTIENWGTEVGIENIINSFEKQNLRHKPLMIDEFYTALIYRDNKQFKVFYDIDELPEQFSKSKVKPITFAELLYVSVYKQSKKIACFNTRYPITTYGSIYPSNAYLKTTIKSDSLYELDDDWKINEKELKAISMPILNEPFMDSMSSHIVHWKELGADVDGDKLSLTFVTYEEAVKEVKNHLNDKQTYLDLEGNLRYGVNNYISSYVLHNFSRGFLENRQYTIFSAKKDDYSAILLSNQITNESKFIDTNKQSFEERIIYETKRLERLSNLPNVYLVGKEQNVYVNFIQFESMSATEGKIVGIGSLEAYQQKGYNKKILENLITLVKAAGVKKLYLKVNKLNDPAIGLYKRVGFKPDNDKESNLSNKELGMSLAL